MMNFLPDLYEGHASITLQHLFRDALEAFEEWDNGDPEPVIIHDDHPVPISVVFKAMHGCTDIVPQSMIGIVIHNLTKPWQGEDPFDRMTFSTASRILGVLVRKRRLFGSTVTAAFIRRHRPDGGS